MNSYHCFRKINGTFPEVSEQDLVHETIIKFMYPHKRVVVDVVERKVYHYLGANEDALLLAAKLMAGDSIVTFQVTDGKLHILRMENAKRIS